jgi:hypothetical protein
MSHTNNLEVTVADSASLSGAIDIGTYVVCGFIPDSGWNTAALTFQASFDGTTYYNLFNGASELAYAAIAASSWVAVDPAVFMGVRFLKVRSGTSGSAVNQTGASVVTVVTRTI